MLQIEKEHKWSTLIHKQKKDLADQIMYLEHNNNVLNDRINQQAVNFNKLCEDCKMQKQKNPCEQCYNYNIGDGIDDIRKCEDCDKR